MFFFKPLLVHVINYFPLGSFQMSLHQYSVYSWRGSEDSTCLLVAWLDTWCPHPAGVCCVSHVWKWSSWCHPRGFRLPVPQVAPNPLPSSKVRSGRKFQQGPQGNTDIGEADHWCVEEGFWVPSSGAEVYSRKGTSIFLTISEVITITRSREE